MCPCVRDRIGIWKCWFLRRGKNRSTRRKTSRSKGENQQQTQPTYGVDAGIWTRATLVGGECSHHCATLAPACPPFDGRYSLHSGDIARENSRVRRMLSSSQLIATSPANEWTRRYWRVKNDFRKKAIYLSVYLLEKKIFFSNVNSIRLKDYVVKTRWREPSVNMYSKKKKGKRKKEIS